MPAGWPTPSTLHGMVGKRVIGHFCGVFLLNMRHMCGRVGMFSETAPFRAAVAAAVPEEEAARAHDPCLAASPPLRCPRRPHARPCPTQVRGSTAPPRLAPLPGVTAPARVRVIGPACHLHRATVAYA